MAWIEARYLGQTLAEHTTALMTTADKTVAAIGKNAIDDSVAALDLRARDENE